MSVQERVDSLKAKHAHLESQINEETMRPMPDDMLINRLKKEKLRIKEEIERIHAH